MGKKTNLYFLPVSLENTNCLIETKNRNITILEKNNVEGHSTCFTDTLIFVQMKPFKEAYYGG